MDRYLKKKVYGKMLIAEYRWLGTQFSVKFCQLCFIFEKFHKTLWESAILLTDRITEK